MLLAQEILKGGEVHFEAFAGGGACRLVWHRAGEAVFSSRGRGLRFRPKRGAAAPALETARRLAGAYAGSLRGREALHATVLAKEGRALALLAPSGEGKSTLAASLLSRVPGVSLVGDDLLRLRLTAGAAWAVPGPGRPRLKLRRPPFPPATIPSRYDPNIEKTLFSFPRSPRLARLAAVVRLVRGKTGPALRRLSGARAVLTLAGSMYNRLFLPPRVLRRQMDLAAKLARRVQVWRLAYPSGLARLREAERLLEKLW